MCELNFECIRDVLKYVRDYLGLNDDGSHTEISWKQIYSDKTLLAKYEDPNIIRYTLEKLLEAGYIRVSHYNKLPKGRINLFVIDDITWEGHNFLQNIENDTIWNNVKEKLKPMGNAAWSAISSVGIECAAAYFKMKLGLP